MLLSVSAGTTQTNMSDSSETKAGSSEAFKHTENQWGLRSDLSLGYLLRGYPASPAAAQPLWLDRKLHTEFTTGWKTLICCCEVRAETLWALENKMLCFSLCSWDKLKVEVTVREPQGDQTQYQVDNKLFNCQFCFSTQQSQHSVYSQFMDTLFIIFSAKPVLNSLIHCVLHHKLCTDWCNKYIAVLAW